MTRRNDRPRTGSSPILDGSKLGDPRSRQSQSAGIDDSMIGPPFFINGKGRLDVKLDPREPLAKRAQGTIGLNIGDFLEVSTGSPPRLNVLMPDIVGIAKRLIRQELAARVPAQDISYSETLVASYLVGDEAPILYNMNGTDIVTSVVLH